MLNLKLNHTLLLAVNKLGGAAYADVLVSYLVPVGLV